jgi:hypothetical protein
VKRQNAVRALKMDYDNGNDANRRRIMQGLGNIAEHAPDDATRKYALQVQTFLAGGGE